ncbi:hypothetical protein ACFQ1S_14440, partial [Kibdelosporangium lantanae]
WAEHPGAGELHGAVAHAGDREVVRESEVHGSTMRLARTRWLRPRVPGSERATVEVMNALGDFLRARRERGQVTRHHGTLWRFVVVHGSPGHVNA